MTIRPTERPQSIREWLALFGKKDVEMVVALVDAFLIRKRMKKLVNE